MLQPSHLKILEALAIYKFLTYTQLLDVGVSSSASYIREKAKELVNRKYVAQFNYGVHAELGRYPLVCYLLPKGEKALLEFGWEEKNIRILKGRSASNKYVNDYFHRRGVVDYHISLVKQAQREGFQIELFQTYFDHSGSVRKGNNLTALTAIRTKKSYFVADAVYIISKNSERSLFCFELHNGKNTKKMLAQLDAYVEAIYLGSAAEKYNIKKSPNVICVFEDNGCMEAVKERFYALKEYEACFKGFRFVKKVN